MKNNKCEGWCSSCTWVPKVSFALVFVGAMNWGLVGIFNWNLVESIFGERGVITIIIYILVAIGGVISLFSGCPCPKKGGASSCGTCGRGSCGGCSTPRPEATTSMPFSQAHHTMDAGAHSDDSGDSDQ